MVRVQEVRVGTGSTEAKPNPRRPAMLGWCLKLTRSSLDWLSAFATAGPTVIDLILIGSPGDMPTHQLLGRDIGDRRTEALATCPERLHFARADTATAKIGVP